MLERFIYTNLKLLQAPIGVSARLTNLLFTLSLESTEHILDIFS